MKFNPYDHSFLSIYKFPPTTKEDAESIITSNKIPYTNKKDMLNTLLSVPHINPDYIMHLLYICIYFLDNGAPYEINSNKEIKTQTLSLILNFINNENKIQNALDIFDCILDKNSKYEINKQPIKPSRYLYFLF